MDSAVSQLSQLPPQLLSILFVTTILMTGYTVRQLVDTYIDNYRTVYLLRQFLAAAELCACGGEFTAGMALSSTQGMVVHVVVWVCLMAWFVRTWGPATANPLSELEKVWNGWEDLHHSVFTIAVQIAGGVTGAKIIQFLYSTVSKEKTYNCVNPLKVSLMYGVWVEALAVFVCKTVRYLYSDIQKPHIMLLNSLVLIAACLIGVRSTSGLYNPMKATVYIYNCGGGINMKSFLLTYWGGPTLGAITHLVMRPVIDDIKGAQVEKPKL